MKENTLDLPSLKQEMIKAIRKKYLNICDTVIENGESFIETSEKSRDDNLFAADLVAKYNPRVIKVSNEQFAKMKNSKYKKEVDLFKSFNQIYEQEKSNLITYKSRVDITKQLKGRLETLPDDCETLEFLMLLDRSIGIQFKG